MNPMDELDRLSAQMRRRQQAREAERKAARLYSGGTLRRRPIPNNRFLREGALICGPIGRGAEFWITYTGAREAFLRLRADPDRVGTGTWDACDPQALNGYVAFPKRRAPRLPKGTGNIVQYIPVHGGVTYAHKDSFAAVWGFDTMHAGSEREPRTDRHWIRAHCWILYRGLRLAEQLWPEFRRAGQARRAALAQQLLDLVEEQNLPEKLGFEAMLNMLAGKVG